MFDFIINGISNIATFLLSFIPFVLDVIFSFFTALPTDISSFLYSSFSLLFVLGLIILVRKII